MNVSYNNIRKTKEDNVYLEDIKVTIENVKLEVNGFIEKYNLFILMDKMKEDINTTIKNHLK